jgi:hydroxylamine reductase
VPLRKENTYLNRMFTTGMAGYPGAMHIEDRKDGKPKDFGPIIEVAKKCLPPKEIETGEIVGGFAHATVLSLADKVIDAVKSGAIKRFVVMAGCDGRMPSRMYFSEVAEKLRKDTVSLLQVVQISLHQAQSRRYRWYSAYSRCWSMQRFLLSSGHRP